MEKKTDLVIILPLYNPHQQWYIELMNSINAIKEIFEDLKIEIVIVNDGSKTSIQNEINILKENFDSIKLIENHKNMGKGYAIRNGLKNASANYYIYTDWDFPFGEKILYNFYKKLIDENYDIVLSNRSKKYYQVLPKEREIISRLLKLISFFLLRFNVYDTQAGLKAINENGKEILIQTKVNNFLFELEFIKNALRNKLQLATIEVLPKSNIIFTNFSIKTLKNETKSLFKIIFNVNKK